MMRVPILLALCLTSMPAFPQISPASLDTLPPAKDYVEHPSQILGLDLDSLEGLRNEMLAYHYDHLSAFVTSTDTQERKDLHWEMGKSAILLSLIDNRRTAWITGLFTPWMDEGRPLRPATA